MKINPLYQNTTKNNGNMTGPEKIKLKGALRDFESLFLFYMLKGCFKPSVASHPGSHIYQEMIREALSSQLAKNGGLGLADSLEKNFDLSPINIKK